MYASTVEAPAITIIKGKLSFCILFIPFADKLYWISATRPPQSHSEAYFFNID